MDFKDTIKQLSERVVKLKNSVLTEEATKNSFIMPFIQILGYDIFNPFEVIPEMTCDIGSKKGEKIDYAIMKDGEAILLIECKHWAQDLTIHDNQMIRYFNVSKAKFGLLTNGIIYKFYTDLVSPNKMDEKPFLEIDITDIKENQYDELKKFHKSYFNLETIISSASELKYASELKELFAKEFTEPSPEFVKYFFKKIYAGTITAKLLDQFTSLTKHSLSSYVNDMISDRLKLALKKEEAPAKEVVEEVDSKVVTTPEEIESYLIVKAILCPIIDIDRVVYKDSQNYFSIFLDGSNRKPICRMYLNGTKKYVSTYDETKKENKVEIQSLNEIYGMRDDICNIVKLYLEKE